MDHIYTDYGVQSSSHFSFTSWTRQSQRHTHAHTQRVADTTNHPTHATAICTCCFSDKITHTCKISSLHIQKQTVSSSRVTETKRRTVELSCSWARTDFIAVPHIALVITEFSLSCWCWRKMAACCDSDGSWRAVNMRRSRYSDATQLCQPLVTSHIHTHVRKVSNTETTKLWQNKIIFHSIFLEKLTRISIINTQNIVPWAHLTHHSKWHLNWGSHLARIHWQTNKTTTELDKVGWLCYTAIVTK